LRLTNNTKYKNIQVNNTKYKNALKNNLGKIGKDSVDGYGSGSSYLFPLRKTPESLYTHTALEPF